MNKLDPSLIADLPPFLGISVEKLNSLLEQSKPSRISKGAKVFEQEEKAHSFFLLLDGTIRVVKTTPNGEQMIARYIATGELFGLSEALGLSVYPANAVAAVDCIVLTWPNSVWSDTIAQHPTFATNTYQTIGARLQESQDRIMEMTTERVEQRVASALMKLTKQTGRKTDDGILINFPISRQDISEMTGTTLHTVSRLLSSWEQSGLVKSGRQKITVSKSDALELIANGRPTAT